MEKKDTLSSCSESEEQQMQLIQDKSKESCMVSFQRLHSHLKRLSNNDLKGSRTENGFGRAFATLFGQDFETFTGTMFLNMDQLQKQLDNNKFQEIGSMASFKVIETQVNERQTQTTEEKIDTSNALDALDASSVIIESNGTESQKQDTSSKLGNDADIRPIYDEEPMTKTVAQCQKDFAKLEAHCINLELQMENNVSKLGQQSQFVKEKENELLHKEKEHLKQSYKDLFDSIKMTRVQTKDQNDSLMAQLNKKSNENVDVLAQIQKNGFAITTLKNELRKLAGNSVNTKFAKPSILGKPVLQPHRNQFVVRQPTAFKSERPKILKERFSSQVDVSNDLSKPVPTHYLSKRRESAPAKPHYMIAPSSSRYSSNDIVHNHYLEEAKKKTQEHSRNSRNFSDSKHFVCSTCQKCVFNANYDSCVTKFLKEVNSRAKVPSNKTTNRNKPVEQIRVATKPNRQIPTGHRILKTVCLRWVPTGKIFTSSTTKVDSEPPNGSKEDITNQCESEQALDVSADISENRASRNFDLMINKWRLLKITLQAPFLNVQLTFEQRSSSLVLHQMTSDHNRSELGIQDHSNEQSSSKLVPKVVPLAVKTATSRQELELLFHHHIAMLRTTGINPMIQPEPEDLPKDNPKLEIAVLSSQAVNKSPTQYPCDICQNIRVILLVFTMKMEILLESTSNKLSVAFKMRHSMRMLVKDTRSQDGIDDKDNEKGSKSRSESMNEQAYNKEQRERPRPHELNDKSNLIGLIKECHQ
ncbi:hypothetical protein Tco_0877871 [Tanacetum coccineum]|uniref:Uncharacterized protein n=1 Tax=Tanacetum coccineum TaxID=301880 RepID=A0ABQ5BW98_9ASTR